MTENKQIILVILTIGLGVGILFSYLTRETTYVVSTFVALATVQGAFVGIVFSIFILASQVNATEFSPLTLEQLSKSNTFLGLLSFYALSILFDIYVIQTQGVGFSIPVYLTTHMPNSWNYTVGVAAGLASISLFSLILARNLLVSLTSPETLLEQSSKNVTNHRLLTKSDSQSGDVDLKPERTPLLTIERILSSTSKKDDEYTVQLSIYYMYKTIKSLLENRTEYGPNRTSIQRFKHDPLRQIRVLSNNRNRKISISPIRNCLNRRLKSVLLTTAQIEAVFCRGHTYHHARILKERYRGVSACPDYSDSISSINDSAESSTSRNRSISSSSVSETSFPINRARYANSITFSLS